MAQPKFLVEIKVGGVAKQIQTDELHPRHPEIMRYTAKVAGKLRYTSGVATGKYDARRFELYAKGNGPAGMTMDGRVEFPATAEGVKTRVRRLRDQEAMTLDGIDAEIEALKALLSDKREQRRAVVKVAWQRANVVRLAEVEEACSQRAAGRIVRISDQLTGLT